MKKEFDCKTRYNDGDVGISYLLAILVPVIIGFVLSQIFGIIATSKGLTSFVQSIALYSIYGVVVSSSLLLVFFVYNKSQRIDFKKASLIKFKFGWKNAVICIFIAIVMLFGFMQIINYLSHLMSLIGYNPDSSLPLPLDNAWWLLLNIFVLAVVPAICEEFIYRGIILNGSRKFGAIAAIMISALFFALAHGSAMQFFYQFIIGAVCAAVVIKTGSLLAGILVHFINNATVLIYNYISLKTAANETAMVFGATEAIMAIATAFLAGIALWLLVGALRERKIESPGNNETINEEYSKEFLYGKKFVSNKSKLIFLVALVIAVILWIVGTIWG